MKNIKEIHFFDLDSTLWSMSSMIWIIDKEEPGKPLMKLSYREYKIIKAGIYKKDDILIKYNDQSYYISQKLLDKLQKKKKSINADRIGFSFIELLDNKYIDKIKFLISNIYHLRGQKNIHIGLLSARWDRHKDGPFLNRLRIELKDLGLDIDKIFFVSDYLEYNVSDKAAYNKTKVILEHLIGFKIEKNKFVSIKQDKYDTVYFYDDEVKNINVSNSIQEYFNELVLNTNDEVYSLIKKRFNETTLKLVSNWISNNEYNRFASTETILTEPVKYPIKMEKRVYNFKEFINENKFISDDTFAKEMMLFLYKIITDETNLEIEENSQNMVIIKWYDDDSDLVTIDYDEINNSYNYSDEFNNDMKWYKLKDLKNYTETCLENYYEEFNKTYDVERTGIVYVPVMNDKYSDYIYSVIMKYPKNIKHIHKIKQYLNKETLDKLQHLIDANNFDLI